MKYWILIFVMMCQWATAQIKDTIFGKPKFVREKVVFLTERENHKLWSWDGDYGHSGFMSPEHTRRRFRGGWFDSEITHYINNETYYDENRNVIREDWFYKNGELLEAIHYQYDSKGRLKYRAEESKYSSGAQAFFYKNGVLDYYDETWLIKSTNEKGKYRKYYHNLLRTREYDVDKREEKTFEMNNFLWKKGEDGKLYAKEDSIYMKKITKSKIYNDKNLLIELKNYDLDYDNQPYVVGIEKYEYDEKGQKIKEIRIQINGEVQEMEGYTEYSYNDKGYLLKKSRYWNNKLSNQATYTYNGDYIESLVYYDDWGEKDGKKNDTIIVKFKYKFDKHKNWTETTKNVNGKDLYVWKREIEYY